MKHSDLNNNEALVNDFMKYVLAVMFFLYAIAVFPLPSIAGSDVQKGKPVAERPELVVGDVYTIKKGRTLYEHKIVSVGEDGSFIMEVKNLSNLKQEDMRFDKDFSSKQYIDWHNDYNYTLRFPLKVGKRWTDEVVKRVPAYASIVLIAYKFKVVSYENVEVGHKIMKAFKIEFSLVGGDGKGTIWYSPELRFVVKEKINLSDDMFGFSVNIKKELVKFKGGINGN